jgi:hypothetical protein
MATGKLIGTDAVGTQHSPDGFVQTTQYTCIATGIVSEIRLHCLVNSNVRAAIYSDNGSNKAGSLLAESNSVAITAGDWRTVALNSNANLTYGSKYWLAFQCQTVGGVSYRLTTLNRGYIAQAYGAFPSTGLNWTYDILVDYGIQGYGILTVAPSSINQLLSYGSLILTTVLSIKPSGITQALAYGIPTVLTNELIIRPVSIIQIVATGMPTLYYPQTISPSGLVQPISTGRPWVGIFGFIRPQSTVQQVAIGSPTILKYVWHVILDGQYATETPGVNRSYIIGRDQYGNPVYGMAVDSTELDLVGECLDFQQELAIPTDSQAASMASAVLSKMRLTKARGVILIPPNCGQELFDVVQISDTGANQSAVSFRVVGIRFEYNPKQAKYEHRLILGAT